MIILQSLIAEIEKSISKMLSRIYELNNPDYQDKYTGLWIDPKTKEQDR